MTEKKQKNQELLEDLKFLFSIIKTVSCTFEEEKRFELLKKKYKLNSEKY